MLVKVFNRDVIFQTGHTEEDDATIFEDIYHYNLDDIDGQRTKINN